MNHNTDKKLEFHEAANIFPLDEEHLDDLVNDIRKHGQQVAIEVLDGQILDGRRRYLACNKAWVEAKFREVKVTDPVAYVLSLNLYRRHLNPSQLAMVGARARDYYDRQAKERQKEHGKTAPGKSKSLPVSLPEVISGDARDHAAKAVGVSGKSIDYATKVVKNAIPEVVKAVDEGRMAVSTAAILAWAPEDVQRREVSNPKLNRQYKTKPNGAEKPVPQKPKEKEDDGEIKLQGVGVMRAHEAINCLKRIPKNDAINRIESPRPLLMVAGCGINASTLFRSGGNGGYAMTEDDFDIYYAIMLDSAFKEGFLIQASDYVTQRAQAQPENPKLETPLDLGVIVLTHGAEESLSDDDIISALRRQRWGDYGHPGADAVAHNAEIVAGGTPEPILGVFITESGAAVVKTV